MRVLVVEDHEDTREVLVRLLEHWGFSVASAETLQNGLDVLQGQPFDAIVSDIALPDGTGYALVNAAKKRDADILAIALSGYSSASDKRIGRMCGFDYHLTKPFDCQQLRSILIDSESQGPSGSSSLGRAH